MSDTKDTPQQKYNKLLSSGKLTADEGQALAIKELDTLYFSLLRKTKKSWQFWVSPSAPQGIYMFGGVGRGKTMLMDLFFSACPDGDKQRLHFHDFMAQAHSLINRARKANAANPIETAARQIIQNGKLVCFDEMEVRDIADAMIISRLFASLWQHGMVLVTTSNRQPDGLYENGLHRDRFLPFMKQLKSNVKLIHIQSGDDFRKQILAGIDGWIFPYDENAERQISDLFSRLLQDNPPQQDIITSSGREIIFKQTGADIALVQFDELCRTALAAGDFLIIADRFKGLLMQDVPVLGDDQRDAARRFMWLVDALYDRGRFLVIGAVVAREEIYTGEDWQFEFSRTLSRLTQMSRYHLPSQDEGV
ncbi:MAG: cell division protein ZapE [Alphaproteobacteria bacterium]